MIAVLARLQDQREAVHRIVEKIAGLGVAEREAALKVFLILSGLRHLGTVVEQEARKMPILNDILDHEVLGREFKKGLEEGKQQGLQQGLQQGVQQGLQEGMQREATAMLRRLIEARFGQIPRWAEERLTKKSAEELEELGVRVLKAQSLEELLM